MDTEKDFEEATGTGVDEADLATLDVVEDEDPVDLDAALPVDPTIVDPLLALDDESEDKEDAELDDRAEIEAVMWQDYDEK